jgi:hypothetical protein
MKDQRRFYARGNTVFDRNRNLSCAPLPGGSWNGYVAECVSVRAAKLIANALNIYKVRRSKPAEKRS